MSFPELKGFNFKGGVSLIPEFTALLVSLVIYTGAFIAEIVRAGILAVPKGQIEAAQALGLRKICHLNKNNHSPRLLGLLFLRSQASI